MPTKKALNFQDLKNQDGYLLNWASRSGGTNKIVFPKELNGSKSNIIILTPDNFPTGSINDGPAYFMVKDLVDNNRIKNNEIKVAALDSWGASFAWAASQFNIKIKVHMPEMLHKYWHKKAEKFGATVVHEPVPKRSLLRIIDKYKENENFISIPENFNNYLYHKNVTGYWVSKAVENIGDNKVSALVTTPGSGGISGLSDYVKERFSYSKTLIVEPDSCSTLFNNTISEHNIDGIAYGFIPYIHNLLGTDYIMAIDDNEIVNIFNTFVQHERMIKKEYSLDGKNYSPFMNNFTAPLAASLIGAISLSKQFYLKETDNIILLAKESPAAYKELYDNITISDLDIKNFINDAFLEQKFHHILDVTGQRQRERLFRKKRDFWSDRGYGDKGVDQMKKVDFWSKFSE